MRFTVDGQNRHVALRREGMATSHGGLLYYVVSVPKDSILHSSSNIGVDGLPAGIISSANSPELSTDSGWDNPFRPDGDLSREADEIVELIKGGKPITPTPGSVSKVPAVEENGIAPPQANSVLSATQQSTSPGKGANGNAPVVANNEKSLAPSSPGAVELQRGTVVPPSDASQVEHIVLKKKPKCKCCVIQ